MPKNQRRVLMALGWYDYRLHRGIEKFALEHRWHLSTNLTREKVIPWGWQGDGILAWLGAGDDLAEFVAKALVRSRLPDYPIKARATACQCVIDERASAGRSQAAD